MSQRIFDAVIFDLDGVITKTALVHSLAWKRMFDEYLKARSEKTGEPFQEFSHEKDYLPYVDGKPRYKGVQSFLESRSISLPFGYPEDDPGKETVCGLGNRKNQAFNEVLDREGVEVYDSTVELMKELRKKGFRVGVASSSKNCEAVLERAGLMDLVETRVDGVVSAEIGLQGKPEPDIFTTAADNLNVVYDRTVVVEDAVSGVQAGKKGNFGLVLGIAREENTHELKVHGADIVVTDIEEIGLEGIERWFESGLEQDAWSISYDDYVPGREKTRETLLAVGNGYLGTRGAFEESQAGESNYPGTYIAGLYNRLVSRVGDRDVENEDFVNIPNWLPVQIKLEQGEWIDPNGCEILSIHRTLSFRSGELVRKMHIKLEDGKELEIRSKRTASMKDRHLVGLTYTLKPLNFDGEITLRTGIDGSIINDGVARYRQLNQQHLNVLGTGAEGGVLQLTSETVQSKIRIALAAKIAYTHSGSTESKEVVYEQPDDRVYAHKTFYVQAGEEVHLSKLVSIYTSQSWDSEDPEKDALKRVSMLHNYQTLVSDSLEAWNAIWQTMDVVVEGDRLAQKLLRLHLYHLMVSFSPHNEFMDASITARGLHGEAYRGHIFWDELFILPLYNLQFPEVSKAALGYRYKRLDAARAYAQAYGYQGAMFPWQSGSDGREETQVVHLNPLTGKWGPDFSSFQRHVSLAIAYNIWQYFHSAQDEEFMKEEGAEMYFEICRFWASKTKWNEKTRRYSIHNVMGPDEFHEKYPGSDDGGLSDNAYTNIMVSWMFDKALELLRNMGKGQLETVIEKIGLGEDEIEQWRERKANLNLIIEKDILAQYDGYFDLKELDWDAYREKYGNIYRMDRLLKAEGKSADDYKVAKQADTLQVFYNLNKSTVSGILREMGYDLSDDYLPKNLKYYLQRTSHGSTLSRVVHAQLANVIDDFDLSWELYSGALTSDYADIQGGTTGEGIHAGVMAGTVLIALQSFAGVDVRGEVVKINPSLPAHWRSIQFGFWFKKNRYHLTVSGETIELSVDLSSATNVEVIVQGEKVALSDGQKKQIKRN